MTEDEAPQRRRRHRRVVAPATNARPEDSPDFTEPRHDLDEGDHAVADGAQEVGSDDWWRAQRPPHWG
ncbi:hypothetical protein [Ornithinimicrobium cavernae]|uniref:hypothetical protein n=1 Tax=Ornithinimicrobium cavernae TaxID=2666047 RepID=UPI000D686037|nr:hypothetical protein [Ornithinimicrobium cavernae]